MGANTCIFCNTSDTLNTAMIITLDDGNKVQVQICNVHAEDATVKTAKAAFVRRQTQIEEVMKQATALGLSLTTQGQSGLVVATSPAARPISSQTINEALAPPQAGVTPILEDDEDGCVVPTSKLDRSMLSVGGGVKHECGIGASVAQYASHNIGQASNRDGNTLDPGIRQGTAKVTVIEGRAGIPVAIQTIRQDGTGLTRLRVANNFTDSKLQNRFKQMAEDSRRDRGPDFRNEYEASVERGCPICGGVGKTKNRGQQIICPKCSGSGIV